MAAQTEKAELKLLRLEPCPFCSAAFDQITFHKTQDKNKCDRDGYTHWIACHVCGASGPVGNCLADAVQRWNGRPILKEGGKHVNRS